MLPLRRHEHTARGLSREVFAAGLDYSPGAAAWDPSTRIECRSVGPGQPIYPAARALRRWDSSSWVCGSGSASARSAGNSANVPSMLRQTTPNAMPKTP